MTHRVQRVVTQLEELIDATLDRGEAPRLPPEVELGERFSVARSTVREALGELEAAGVIERRRRVGTTILRRSGRDGATRRVPLVLPLDRMVPLPRFFEESGQRHEIAAATLATEPCAEAVAARLGIDPGALVLRLSRVFAVEGVRALVMEHVIPRSLTPTSEPLRIESLTWAIPDYLREVGGLHVTGAVHRVTAVVADATYAAALDVRRGAALLSLDIELMVDDGDKERIVALGTMTLNPAIVTLGARGPADA